MHPIAVTDDNETLHKPRRAYTSTNKQLTSILPQLLAARASISNEDDISLELGEKEGLEPGNLNIAQILITPPLSTQRSVQTGNEEDFELRTGNTIEVERVLAETMSGLIESSNCV